MSSVERHVELLEKNKPRQERAKRTYEAILNSAAELLVEVGVERISTNLIAERAGITVPALYRYFPNKYAVLNALGALLMDRQNKVSEQWFNTHLEAGDPEAMLGDVYELLRLTYEVTVEQHGGLEILQALRAVAPLRDLRLTSHRLVAEQFAAAIAEFIGSDSADALQLQARLSVDMGYAMVEMALEDEGVHAEEILREGAAMIHAYWLALLARL